MSTLIKNVFHADHGVSKELVQKLVDTLKPNGFFLGTMDLPEGEPDLKSALYGPVCGDAPVTDEMVFHAHRNNRPNKSRMIGGVPQRPTRRVTIIGMAEEDGVEIYTCYGGEQAPREPGDPGIGGNKSELALSEAFWSQHALAL